MLHNIINVSIFVSKLDRLLICGGIKKIQYVNSFCCYKSVEGVLCLILIYNAWTMYEKM